jgi:hypothetical protein
MALDIVTAIDVYRVVAFPLASDGSLPSVDNSAYEGVEFSGPVSFELNLGAPRTIPVVAQGRVLDTFLLPSIEAKTGTLRCAYDVQTLNALLTGVNQTTVGEAKVVDEGTNKEGQEILVGLLLQQLQAHNESGLTVWRTDIIPRARLSPSNPPMNAETLVKEYTMVAASSSKRLWYETLTTATHGCTSAHKQNVLTEYKLNIVGWTGDGAETTFNFPADKPPSENAKVKVFNFTTGVEVAGALNVYPEWVASVAPASGAKLAAVYEYE